MCISQEENQYWKEERPQNGALKYPILNNWVEKNENANEVEKEQLERGGGSPRQRFSPGPEGGSHAGEAEGAVLGPWSRKVVLGQEIPILVLASGGQNQAISVELGTRTELECVWEGVGDKVRQES